MTGIRRDAYANMHRIPVEETKPGRERGTYLYPDAFNQPEEKSALMVRHPAVMRRAIERRSASDSINDKQPTTQRSESNEKP